MVVGGNRCRWRRSCFIAPAGFGTRNGIFKLRAADAPGKEIPHPVAVVIFGGLISSKLLDTVVTPVMFYLWGQRPLERLLEIEQTKSF